MIKKFKILNTDFIVSDKKVLLEKEGKKSPIFLLKDNETEEDYIETDIQTVTKKDIDLKSNIKDSKFLKEFKEKLEDKLNK